MTFIDRLRHPSEPPSARKPKRKQKFGRLSPKTKLVGGAVLRRERLEAMYDGERLQLLPLVLGRTGVHFYLWAYQVGKPPEAAFACFPVAQLILERVGYDAALDAGQITCSAGPEFLQLLSENDRSQLHRLRESRRISTGDRGWDALVADQAGD